MLTATVRLAPLLTVELLLVVVVVLEPTHATEKLVPSVESADG
jgi:hypothetical protein